MTVPFQSFFALFLRRLLHSCCPSSMIIPDSIPPTTLLVVPYDVSRMSGRPYSSFTKMHFTNRPYPITFDQLL